MPAGLLGAGLLLLFAASLALSIRADEPPPPSPATESLSEADREEIRDLERESERGDIRYFRSRFVFKVDAKRKPGDATSTRLRLEGVEAFGEKNRFSYQLKVPTYYNEAPGSYVTGLGDVSFELAAVLGATDWLFHGAGVEVTLQTASDPVLWGGATTVKPEYGLAALLGHQILAQFVLQFTQSVLTLPEAPAVQKLEPELYLNVHLPWFTLSFDWDNWWDFPAGAFGQTLKVGASQSVDREKRWVVGVSYLFPLNDYARSTDLGTFGLTVTRHLGRK